MQKRFIRRSIVIFALLISTIVSLAGCGGPGDPTLFVMPRNTPPYQLIDKLQGDLQAKFGETKIQVNSSAMYRPDKLFVELAAGGNAVMLLSKSDFVNLLTQGAAMSLDDVFKPEDYKAGVMEATIPGQQDEPDRKETHLYGIPAGKARMLQPLGITDTGTDMDLDMFLFIPINAPDKSASIQMIKDLVE